MKKIITPIVIAAAILTACNKDANLAPESGNYGTIELSISTLTSNIRKSSTKAVETADYEKAIRNVQVFIFGDDGKINVYKNFGASQSGNITTTSGKKDVYAVVNGNDLSSIGSLSSLEAVMADLSENKVGAEGSFVMTGRQECTIPEGATGTARCEIEVSRLAARVALKSVKNSLPSSYGKIHIMRAYLANVAGEMNIAGNAAPAVWYNRYGRKDETPLVADHILDGGTYKASCEELTFREINEDIATSGTYAADGLYFYGCANPSTEESKAFSTGFTPCRSVLVVVAGIQDRTYYYPVVLNKGFVRNTAYEVSLTISSLGSDDPGKPVDKGGMDASISIADWQEIEGYDENI